MEILYLLIGLAAGIIIGVLYSKNKSAPNRSNSDLNNYVAKELYTSEKGDGCTDFMMKCFFSSINLTFC